MTSDLGLLEPLAIFSRHSQSQPYIKSIRNIGDAWRCLSEKPLPECDKSCAIVQTSFGLVLKISPTHGVKISVQGEEITTVMPQEVQSSKDKPQDVKIDIYEQQEVQPSTADPLSNKSTPTQKPRHYRIFADYGTTFLWRDFDDTTPEEGTCWDEDDLQEIFQSASVPESFVKLYDDWVDLYDKHFEERCEKSGNYHVPVFPTSAEEVAWNVTGFLLAWRFAMAPEVGSVEFELKYLLEKGKETDVTLAFLQAQQEILRPHKS